MEREAKPQLDPGAIADDISGVLTALAGVTELGSRFDVPLESTEPLQSLAAEVTSRARTLAKDTLEERVENVGVEDAAIEKARQPIERLPLEDAVHSTVVGSIRDVKSGEGIRGGHIVAKTPDGQLIGESAVDAMGNFAMELTTTVNEVHIEALDETGKSVSASSVELAQDQPAAHFVEMVSSGGRTKSQTDNPIDRNPNTSISRVETTETSRSKVLRRVKQMALETYESRAPRRS